MGPAPMTASRLGKLGQGKQGFIGQIRHFIQPNDGRSRSPCAGGDNRLFEGQPLAPDFNGTGIEKSPSADKHIDPQVGEPLDGVVRSNGCPQPAHPLHGLPEIKLHTIRYVHPELAGIPHGSSSAGSADQGLGRHTADIQTVAAHQVTLNQGNLCPQAGRSRRAYESCGSGADDNQIVA